MFFERRVMKRRAKNITTETQRAQRCFYYRYAECFPFERQRAVKIILPLIFILLTKTLCPLCLCGENLRAFAHFRCDFFLFASANLLVKHHANHS